MSMSRGLRTANPGLTAAQVRRIHEAYRNTETSQLQLARRFGVSDITIRLVLKGRYTPIDGPLVG